MKIIYILDYENNVIKNWLNTISLSENDEVVIFYSDNRDKADLNSLNMILSAGAELTLEEVNSNGRNAMDFCIVAYLGKLIGGSNPNDDVKYIIVSNDKDFKIPIRYLSDKGYAIEQMNMYKISNGATSMETLKTYRENINSIDGNDLNYVLKKSNLSKIRGSNVIESIRRFLKSAEDLEDFNRKITSSMNRRLKHYYGDHPPKLDAFFHNLDEVLTK